MNDKAKWWLEPETFKWALGMALGVGVAWATLSHDSALMSAEVSGLKKESAAHSTSIAVIETKIGTISDDVKDIKRMLQNGYHKQPR